MRAQRQKTSSDPGSPGPGPLHCRVPVIAVVIGAAALAVLLSGCANLEIHDPASLLVPRLTRSEVLGFVAGFGTTFAAVPDLVAMLRRRSSRGMNPTMAGIMGTFQILWIYYGLLIASRPVIVWNTIAVLINFMSVWLYFRFARREREHSASS